MFNKAEAKLLLGVSCLFFIAPGSDPAHAMESQESAGNLDDERIDEIVVTAHRRDYTATSARTALGLDLSLLQTPAAVSVISQDLLKDQQVNNVDEALRNVAGVTRFKTGNGGEEKFTIRGFDVSQSIYKDGARINNGLNVSNIPSTETANIERIEVLKGPSALLYGEGSPGGVINYITKRPEQERYTNIEALAGSYDFFKLEFDTTGAFVEDGPFAYRVVASYEDSESFRDEISRQRLLLNPVVSFTPNDRAQLLLGVEYIDDDYTQDRGQVLDGDFLSGYAYSDRLDAELFFGVPGWNDRTTAESTRVYLRGDYRINDNWRVEATYSRTENDKELFDSNPAPVTPTFALIGPVGDPLENFSAITISRSDGSGESDQVTLKNFIEFTTGSVEHQILASFTSESFDTDSDGEQGLDTIFYNIVTGDYGLNNPFVPVDIRNATFNFTDRPPSIGQDFGERGINVLDYIRLNRSWSVLIGARWSEYEDDLSGFEDDDVSFRGGVVYAFNDNLSAYLSYSEGYSSSQGRLDLNDEVIDPETSESWELGTKYLSPDERLLVTATLYSTEQTGVAFLANPTAPAGEQRFGNIGTFETRGLEIELIGQINDRWRIQGGYSYIDNEITEGGTQGVFGPLAFQFEAGNRLPGIAEHSLNLSSFYEFSLGEGDLGLGGSLFYQDDVFASAENALVYEGWTQVDLVGYYRWGQWKAQLNVRNVFDEDYRLTQIGVTPDLFAAIRVGTSQPTVVLGSISYEF